MNAKTQKILKYSGIGITVLFALLLIVPGFINWNQYKEEMKSVLANATGRDIQISGDLSFSILPAPAFSANGVTIGNIKEGKAEFFADIQRVDIRISFLPLLRGRVDIKSLLLDTPIISLEKLSANNANWDFGDKTNNPTSPSTSINTDSFKVDDFILQNGQLSYRDATTGENYSLESVSARVKASSTKGPFEGNFAFFYKGIPLQAKGTLGAINTGRRTAININAVINNERPGLTLMGSVLVDDKNNDFTFRLRGDGKNLDALIAGLQTISGDTTPIPINLQQNWDINSQITKTGDKFSFTPTSFRIGKTSANLSLDYTTGITDEGGNRSPDTSSLKLTVNSIEGVDWEKSTGSTNINPDKKTANKPLMFSLPNNLMADMEVSIGALNMADGLMRQIALRGKLDKGALAIDRGQVMLPGGADIIANGTLTTLGDNPEFKGTVKASANNLRGTLSWAGVDLSTVPDGVLTGFSLNSGITANQQSIALYDTKGQLDISEFDLAFTLGLEERTRFAIKGKVNRLNLDAYQKPSLKGKTGKTLTNKLNAFKTSLKPLGDFDANWDIEATRLNLAGATMEGLVSKGSLIDDQLSLDTLTINSFEGVKVNIKGVGSAFNTDPNFDLAINLEAKNPQAIVRWSGANLGIETRDLSQLSMSGTLKGNFQNIDIDLKSKALRANLTLEGSLQAPFDNPGDMKIKYTFSHPSHLDMIRRLKLPLKLVGKSKPLNISGNIDGPWDSFDLTSNISALGGKLGWVGIIKTKAPDLAVEGNFDLEHKNLTQLMKGLDVAFTPLNPKKVGGTNISGHIKGDINSFTLTKLTGTVSQSRIEGGLSVQPLDAKDLNGAKNINGRLSVNKINISNFLSPNNAGVTAAQKAGGQRWNEKQLGWNWIAKHQIKFALQADQLSYGAYNLKDLSIGVSLKDGLLNTTKLDALLFGGQLSGTTEVNLKRIPNLTQSFNLKNAQLSPLMIAATGLDTLSGTLNLAGNFTAGGDSQSAMINSLKGTGTFRATEGIIKGINLNKLSAEIPKAIKLTGFIQALSGSLGKGQTAMKSLNATLTADKGIISAPDIKGDLDKSALVGDLTLNLPKWTLGATGRLALTEPANLPGIGATLSGSLSSPKKKFNTSELTAYMAKQLTQRMLQNLLKKPLTKAVVNPPTNQPDDTTLNATPAKKIPTNAEKASSLLKGIKSLIDKNKKKPKTDQPETDQPKSKTDSKTPAPKTQDP